MTQSPSSGPGLTAVGKLVVFLFIALCAAGAVYLFYGKSLFAGRAGGPTTQGGATAQPGGGNTPPSGDAVEIGIAYGTEKERWLKWATDQFAQSAEGRGIKIDLIPMGSVEGANAVMQGDKRINVWAPASRLYKEKFVNDYQGKNGTNPLVSDKAEPLALSPMVFVMWQDRYEAFKKKYGEVNFTTISKALAESGGWNAIANKPEWGLFKFGHTHPSESNSGLMTLVLMAYEYHNKTAGLDLGDITDGGFQKFMGQIEKSLSKPGGTLTNSTGTMMNEMVRFGPSYYDAVFVYESVALDNLKNAEGKWGSSMHLVYPALNSWNDNPYYILNVPWSTPAQRKAAEAYQAFLLKENVQQQVLRFGFRPGSIDVPVTAADSPLIVNASFGAQLQINRLCEPPPAEVIYNLQMSWERMMAK